jgi:RES domain-containing protein
MNIAAGDKKVPVLLAKAKAVPYSDYAFRALPGSSVVHNLHFEHLWAGTSAGRCNPEGVARLYLSLERQTADAEFRHYQEKGGCDPNLADFYSFSVKVNLTRVLDLREKGTRKLFDLSVDKILADWEPDPLGSSRHPPLTRLQVIGYWISEGCADFSGIICHSARRRGGHNLVIFQRQLAVGDLVVPISSVATKGWSHSVTHDTLSAGSEI